MINMRDAADAQNNICNRAFEAETAGRLDLAIEDYRRAIAYDKLNPTPYLYLGYALEQSGQRNTAVQVYSIAADLDARVINAWRNSGAPGEIRERSRSADRAVRAHFTQLHADSVAAFHRERPGADLDRIYAAIWCQTHAGDTDYRRPDQRPHVFYVPDLTPTAVFDTRQLPCISRLQRAAEEIQREYLRVQPQSLSEHRAYVESPKGLGAAWQPLIESLNWSSIHLYKHGNPNHKMLDLYPRTWAVLNELPLLRINGAPREVLFSVLRGRQHIPRHFGLSNTDATVHLPLLVPQDAGIRVGDVLHEWRAGEAFAFDDSFDHESWNRSAEPRVNLLFEVWHPDLSRDERDAVAATFEARERWSRSRRVGPASSDGVRCTTA